VATWGGPELPKWRDPHDADRLINAGPWLPVPPPDYGGIENVLATLIPELRARGVEVVLCTVEESTVAVDDRRCAFPDGQFGRLAGPYAQVMGITHAHMATVLETLRSRRDIDLVHDHLEVVGPSVLGRHRRHRPPVLQTLHWDLRKHPEFYGAFDGKGRVFFNAVSNAQLAHRPRQPAPPEPGRRPPGRRPGRPPVPGRQGRGLPGPRSRHPVQGPGRRRPHLQGVGVPLADGRPGRRRDPPRGSWPPALEDPASPLHGYGDVRHYLDAVPAVRGRRADPLGGHGRLGRTRTS
jgi:hypothetical protein